MENDKPKPRAVRQAQDEPEIAGLPPVKSTPESRAADEKDALDTLMWGAGFKMPTWENEPPTTRESLRKDVEGIDTPLPKWQPGLEPVARIPVSREKMRALVDNLLDAAGQEEQLKRDASMYGFSAVKKVYDPKTGEVHRERVSPHDVLPSRPAVPHPLAFAGTHVHATYPHTLIAILEFQREVEICMCTYVIMGDTPETTVVRNDALQTGEHRRDCPAWEFTWRRRLARSFDVELRNDE